MCRARCAVGTLALVTGRPLVRATGDGLAWAASASIPILRPCWRTRSGLGSWRMSFGASLNTRFSANLWKAFHWDAIAAKHSEARHARLCPRGSLSIPWDNTIAPGPGDSHQQFRRQDVHRAGADTELLHHRP